MKERIEKLEESKNVPVSSQKLIHAGRVLENDTIIGSVVKDGDYIVLMTVRAPTKAAPIVPTVASTVAQATHEETKGENQLLTGQAYEEALARLVEMGFDREQAISAMRASFNNPDRAAEYLMSGSIPRETEATIHEESSEHQETGAEAIQALRDDPQFRQIRTLIQQNPQMLGVLVDQIGQSNPEFLRLIDENREAFTALLMETSDGGEVPMGSDDSDSDGGEDDEPTGEIIDLTQEEMNAIGRLEQLGFEKGRAIEAYLACDKNEELAANFLFENLD